MCRHFFLTNTGISHCTSLRFNASYTMTQVFVCSSFFSVQPTLFPAFNSGIVLPLVATTLVVDSLLGDYVRYFKLCMVIFHRDSQFHTNLSVLDLISRSRALQKVKSDTCTFPLSLVSRQFKMFCGCYVLVDGHTRKVSPDFGVSFNFGLG